MPTQGVNNLVQVVQGKPALDQSLDALVGGADGLGNLVDVLRLDDGLEIILEKLREVVCQRVSPLTVPPEDGNPYSATRSRGSA